MSTTYSRAELPEVITLMQKWYSLDMVRLFRYAGRRNRKNELEQYLNS
ncbi:DUF6577 family protein [Galactobacillus timonensis]